MAKSKWKIATADGVIVEVEECVIEQCKVLQRVKETCNSHDAIPTPAVRADLIPMIEEFCLLHATDAPYEPQPLETGCLEELDDRDEQFFSNRFPEKEDGTSDAPSLLGRLLCAADFLENTRFMDAALMWIRDHRIRGKSIAEMGEYLGVTQDHTPEEIQQLKNEQIWYE